MSDRASGADTITDDTTGAATGAMDTLLRAVETMPASGAPSWDIDLLRQALLIARATESPADLERADLAYQALSRDSRARLAEHAATLAKRHAGRRWRASAPAARPAGGLAGFFAALTGRTAETSGRTAKDRLLRDLASRPPADAGRGG